MPFDNGNFFAAWGLLRKSEHSVECDFEALVDSMLDFARSFVDTTFVADHLGEQDFHQTFSSFDFGCFLETFRSQSATLVWYMCD